MYSVKNYGSMIRDAGRTGAYAEALRRAVTPQSVVLDIGTGTGIFAMLACRLGARRVFAVEPGEAVSVAEEIARVNGYGDRIEFFQAMSTELTLPERADVIVSDLHGVLPLFRQHLVTIADARARLLAPGGTLIPLRDTLWATAVEAPKEFQEVASPWSENAYGFDMSPARAIVANTFTRAAFEPAQLLAEPVACGTLDYSSLEDANFRAEVSLFAARNGVGHGLALWFDSVLADGIGFTNAPDERHVYGNAYFPWPEPLELGTGDRIEVKLRADLVGSDYLWSWDTRIASAAGTPRKAFSQSEFFGEPMSLNRLRRQGASHVPQPNEQARVDHFILGLMNARKPLGDIAREVAARFPTRYPRWEDALTHVGELSLRYGRQDNAR